MQRKFTDKGIEYSTLSVAYDRAGAHRHHFHPRPGNAAAGGYAGACRKQGADFWPLRLARELDDAILDIRSNELELAVIVFKSSGDIDQVLAYDALLEAGKDHWLAREIRSYWKRVLKRIDVTSRSLVAVIEPGSCFAGTLAEIVLACDRSYMLIGQLNGSNQPAAIALNAHEFRRLSDAERDFAAGKPFPA